MKAPFVWFGGKRRVAPEVWAALGDVPNYIEPFAGSLAVLLAKKPADMETVNDLDEDLINFWQVLRDHPTELITAAFLTPHSRLEHQRSFEPTEDPLERARRTWVSLSQNRGGGLTRSGWRFYRDPAGSASSFPDYLDGYVQRMPPAVHRLRSVSLESRPALEVIADYGQHPKVCLYVDPPYLGSTRNSRKYRHEMADEPAHRELAEALRRCAAAVVLSGYPSPLYEDLYEGWHRHEMAAWTALGLHAGGDGNRTEVLWSNRPFENHQASMFEDVS